MTLHLVELEVDFRKLLQGAKVKDGTDPGYHLHAWLSGTFGPGMLQPFHWNDDRRRLLAYAQSSGEELLALADQFAGAEARAAIKTIHTKRMPEAWPEGVRVGFVLRAAPTVRLAKDIEGRARRGGEVDAYNAARWRGDERTRSAIYEEWVGGQFARHGSVQLSQFRLDGHRLTKMVRRTQGGGRTAKSIVLPEMMCSGVLVATAGHTFTSLLERGVGRHRAFGFGMLLLRPPGRR